MTAAPPAQSHSALDERAERSLIWLMFGRLVLSVVSFGIAIGLDGVGQELSLTARRGLYWTVTFAFAATVVSGMLVGRIRRPLRLAYAQIATDVVIVTLLVHFSGGRESVFNFLYVMVTGYGALLFERRGAVLAASSSAGAYAVVLFGAHGGWLPGAATGTGMEPRAMLVAVWGVHVGALFVVGALSSALAGELRRSVRSLQQIRDLHQRTVESLLSGLLTTDDEGRITSFNPEAEGICGTSAASVLGVPVEEVIPGVGALVMGTGGSDGQPGSAAPRVRLAYRNRRGAALHLGVAGSVLKNVEGRPVGRVVIFQDVTEIVAMEAQLRSSERLAAVGEMAAKMAHEIRNPLAAISGSVQILQADLSAQDEDAAEARLMGIVVRETDRLNALIADFLHFARPAPVEMEAVSVGEVIHDLLAIFGNSCPRDIEIDLAGLQPVWVLADRGKLQQVLWNLCLNGVQAMPEGGTLRIASRSLAAELPQDDSATSRNGVLEGIQPVEAKVNKASPPAAWVEVSVSDSGAGIPLEVQERIFEPFFTTKKEGTGLGLATVFRIVESHGGSLLLESEEGQGTTFRVRLPAAEEAR